MNYIGGSMRSGFRFSPPDIVQTPEIRWLLVRAFGPIERSAASPEDPKALVEAAGSLDLAPRLVARLGGERLSGEIGDAAAGELMAEYKDSASRSVQLIGLARLVAEAAASVAIPVVFLKFGGLELGGYLQPGSRGAVDLDVLVPTDRARDLQACLLRSGYREADLPEHEHQLRPLAHRAGLILEIHRILLGVRVHTNRSATAQVLDRFGLLSPLLCMPGHCAVPVREVLVAHAIVHGLAQHGFAPQSYPLLRTIADLIDLGIVRMAEEGGLDRIREWSGRAVTPAEIDETVALCRALSAGHVDELASGTAPGSRLLRHILAGSLAPAYGLSLTRSRIANTLTDRSRPLELVSSLWKAVWPSRSQLDVLYGPSGSSGRVAWLRLIRPFDLLRRRAARR